MQDATDKREPEAAPAPNQETLPGVDSAPGKGAADARLRAAVRKAMADGGLSQARSALEIGISDSALSTWLAEKYRGDSAAVAAKARAWLKAVRRRAALEARLPDAPAWIETESALRVGAVLGYAQMAGDMALVHGGAGTGKTVAARRFAEGRATVWYLEATSGARSLTSCLERVARATGARSESRRAAGLEDAIAGRLRGTRGLLVIDEAQHLALPALEALRGLHDACGVGLALVGGERLHDRLADQRRATERAQLVSRIGRRLRLPAPTGGDVDALLAGWGLDAEALRRQAMEIARRPGGLRNLTKRLRMAALFAGGAGKIGWAHLSAAGTELGG